MSQTLALFSKVIRKITKRLVEVQKAAISADIPEPSTRSTALAAAAPIAVPLEEELDEAGAGELSREKQRQREMIDSLDLKKYVARSFPPLCPRPMRSRLTLTPPTV